MPISRPRTMAYSILFPSDTATRSPFFTPLCNKPRAKSLLFLSRPSYVRRVRWWRETTLSHMSSTIMGYLFPLLTLYGLHTERRSNGSARPRFARVKEAGQGESWYRKGRVWHTSEGPREYDWVRRLRRDCRKSTRTRLTDDFRAGRMVNEHRRHWAAAAPNFKRRRMEKGTGW